MECHNRQKDEINTYIFFKNIIHCFTNFEIVTLFKNCTKILLFLLKKQIAKIDESTIDIFINMVCKDRYYCHFFYPEIKSLNSDEIDLTEIESEVLQIDEFEAKRKNGEIKIDHFISINHQKNEQMKALKEQHEEFINNFDQSDSIYTPDDLTDSNDNFNFNCDFYL